MVEKIDVIDNVIYIYNENMELINSVNVDTIEGLNLTYLNSCKLFSINISKPTKRVVKFSELQGVDTNAIFVETLYENMTEQQVIDFDNFVNIVSELP